MLRGIRGRRRIAMLAGIAGALLIPATALADGDTTGVVALEENPALAVNFAWTLIAAFLVFFMQAGFALVETGFARRRNTVNIMSKNFMDFCIGGLAFWAFGFAIMFGGSALASGLGEGNDWFGYSGFFLTGDAYDVSTMELWFFQMVFAATAATIVSGAMAERTKINAYLAYTFLISALVYPIYGHWVWGGGWLSTLDFGQGAKDFAGSGVVHAVGGISALIGAWMLGPRLGKFDANGRPRTIPGHNITFVVLGTFILFFGWFGFNPGSTLAATDLRIAVIAVTTFLAGVTGAVVAFYWSFMRTGKADITLAANGALAGLVAITAPCAYVGAWAAVVIGAIGAIIMIASLSFVERVLKIDDPVGAASVHGAAGLWGVLAVGIFADGTYPALTETTTPVEGLLYGDGGQIVAQLISMAAVVVWTVLAAGLVFFLIRSTIGLRVTRQEEMEGLDMGEHGLRAYPEDEVIEVVEGGGVVVRPGSALPATGGAGD
jgi:Amt family ammonium transporter